MPPVTRIPRRGPIPSAPRRPPRRWPTSIASSRGDAVALQVIAGLGDGLVPAEIRRRYGLTATAYDTARRRMRRALLRRDGDGGTP